MGRISYNQDDLVRVLNAVEHRSVSHAKLPMSRSGSDAFPDLIPDRVASGLVAYAAFLAVKEHQSDARAAAEKLSVHQFRLRRASEWMLLAESGYYMITEGGFGTIEGDYRWFFRGTGNVLEAEFETWEAAPDVDDEEEEEDEFASYVLPERVMFNREQDAYTYYSNKQRRMVRLPGRIVRGMRTDYSNDGGGFTLNEVARKYKIPRAYVEEMKTLFGWTKDQSIYTAEELIEGDRENLDHRAVEAIEGREMRRFDRTKLRSIEKAARKWMDTERNIRAFMESYNQQDSRPAVPKIAVRTARGEPGAKMAVVTPFDFHYGARKVNGQWQPGWSTHRGESPMSTDGMMALMEDRMRYLCEEMAHFNLERIHLPLGHDWFHVNSNAHTTAAGTPQDTDRNFIDIVRGGCDVMEMVVEMLRQIALVEVIWVPGNHDTEASLMGMLRMEGLYKNTPDVNIYIGNEMRAYALWKENLMGHVHGDGINRNDLPRTMANEVRECWGVVRNTMWFVGHFHFEKTTDLAGTQIFQAASLSSADRWHHKKQFVGSRRAMDAYIIHETRGKIDQITALAEPVVSASLLLAA